MLEAPTPLVTCHIQVTCLVGGSMPKRQEGSRVVREARRRLSGQACLRGEYFVDDRTMSAGVPAYRATSCVEHRTVLACPARVVTAFARRKGAGRGPDEAWGW